MNRHLVLGVDVLPTRLHPAAAPADHATEFATSGLFASILPNSYRIASLFDEPSVQGDGKIHLRVRNDYRWNDGCELSQADLVASGSAALERFSVLVEHEGDGVTLTPEGDVSWSAVVKELRGYRHVAVPATGCSRPHLSCGPYHLVEHTTHGFTFERDHAGPCANGVAPPPRSVDVKLIDVSTVVDELRAGRIDVSPPLGSPPGSWTGLVSRRVGTAYFAGLETLRTRRARTARLPDHRTVRRKKPVAAGAYRLLERPRPSIPVDVDTLLWVDYPPNRELLEVVQCYYQQLLGHSLAVEEVSYRDYIHRPNVAGTAKLAICHMREDAKTAFYPVFQAVQMAISRVEDADLLSQFNDICLFDWSLQRWT